MKIALSIALALFLVGCGDDAKKETPKQELKQEVVAPVKAEVKKAEPVQEVVAPAKVEAPKEIAQAPELRGDVIFRTCSGCHGADASKAALGKSQIIKGWDAKKVSDALHGYKNGTYGGAMKGVMKGQASKLSEEEIKVVAEYISTL